MYAIGDELKSGGFSEEHLEEMGNAIISGMPEDDFIQHFVTVHNETWPNLPWDLIDKIAEAFN